MVNEKENKGKFLIFGGCLISLLSANSVLVFEVVFISFAISSIQTFWKKKWKVSTWATDKWRNVLNNNLPNANNWCSNIKKSCKFFSSFEGHKRKPTLLPFFLERSRWAERCKVTKIYEKKYMNISHIAELLCTKSEDSFYLSLCHRLQNNESKMFKSLFDGLLHTMQVIS